MSKARTHRLEPWTADDHTENARRIQRDADRRLWQRLGRLLGIRGADLSAALARMIDDRIASALAKQPTLVETLLLPDVSPAVVDVLGEMLSGDIAEMVQILLSQGSNNDAGYTPEATGSGGEDATYVQRDIYRDEEEEA